MSRVEGGGPGVLAVGSAGSQGSGGHSPDVRRHHRAVVGIAVLLKPPLAWSRLEGIGCKSAWGVKGASDSATITTVEGSAGSVHEFVDSFWTGTQHQSSSSQPGANPHTPLPTPQ